MQVHARFSKRRLHINPPSTSSRINCRRSSQPLTHLGPKLIKTSSTATTMVGQGPWLRLKRTAIMNQAANIFTMQAATAKHGAGVARARPWLSLTARPRRHPPPRPRQGRQRQQAQLQQAQRLKNQHQVQEVHHLQLQVKSSGGGCSVLAICR